MHSYPRQSIAVQTPLIQREYSSRTNCSCPVLLTSQFFRSFMLPSSMLYERKFGFQIAAQERASGSKARSAYMLARKLPPRGSKFFVDRTATVSKCRRGSPSTIHKPRVANHGILIETQRLEFPATRTKQRLRFISNRDKTAVFSSGLPVEAQNQRESSPPEFLIANLELEFFLSTSKSIKYNFLIANKLRFCAQESGESVKQILARRPTWQNRRF
jgi:hypothetical protein